MKHTVYKRILADVTHYPSQNFRMVVAVVAAFTLIPFSMVPLHGHIDITCSSPMILVQADPHHRGTLLAGTARALLFRSRDKGETWVPLHFAAELRATLHAILIDPARPNVYLVAVSSETPLFAGVFQSVDEGATWEQLRDLRQKQVWSLAFWAGDARVIAAGAQDGVFLTRNGGETWTSISSTVRAAPRPVVSLAFDPTDSNILYAGTPHLAWKTTNGGATWRRIYKGMQEDSDVFSIDVDRNQPKRLFAGACSGIYRSIDGGSNWASLAHALGEPFRTYVVACHPGNANLVYAGTSGGVLQSLDGGATWRRLWPRTARSIAFDPTDPRGVFVATDHGILRSEDHGHHFSETNQGLYEQSNGLEIGHNGVEVPSHKNARTFVIEAK